MIGLKKRRYGRKVMISLRVLFGDVSSDKGDHFAPKIKHMYPDWWQATLEDELHPPELAALILAVHFYEDMINNYCSDEDLETIKKSILESIYDFENQPLLLLKLTFTVLVTQGWKQDEIISQDALALAMRDIHRAIFDGDDEHLTETLTFLFEGGSLLKLLQQKVRHE